MYLNVRKPDFVACEQQRCRPACKSVQSGQHLCYLESIVVNLASCEELRALRGYFGPPMRLKNENCFSPNSSYQFIRTMAQVYNSGIILTFTIAMITKMAAKIG